MKEQKSYEVSVTITFTANVEFSSIERDTAITAEDALNNFYGYGLSDVIESGEYSCNVSQISVEEVQS